MGQCVSRKAAKAFAAKHRRPSNKKKKKNESPDEDNNKISRLPRPSKGVATSFGFRRAPAKPETRDANGNEPKRTQSASRLPAPKKDGSNSRPASRFGFRHIRSTKVADSKAAKNSANFAKYKESKDGSWTEDSGIGSHCDKEHTLIGQNFDICDLDVKLPTISPKQFLKTNVKLRYSSSTSSEEMWCSNGGEAMAEVVELKKSPFKFKNITEAASSETLLDDETSPSPIDSDSDEVKTVAQPETPTHTTNSSSISEAKDDFLIDDEISDQPALLFQGAAPIKHFDKPKLKSLELTANLKNLRNSVTSLDTLSPSESIFSDDLMMDFEISDADEQDIFNSPLKSLKGSKVESLRSNDRFKEVTFNEGKSRSKNITNSPICSRLSKPSSSPLRLRKSPVQDSTVKQMITIKTDLVKLWRILNGSEVHPYGVSDQFNGIYEGLSGKKEDDSEVHELRRQVLFMRGLLEDKEKDVEDLRKKLSKVSIGVVDENRNRSCSNAATQTDRIRSTPNGLNDHDTIGSSLVSFRIGKCD